MHREAVAVATLVLLAGCSAVPFGSGDGRSGPPDTVTPVPVTESPSPPRTVTGERPAGVSADGTVNADALSEAHVAAVGDSTYTWSIERVTTGDDPERFSRQVVVGNGTFVVTQSRDWTGANVSMFVNGTGGFLRTVTGDRVRYDFYRAPGGPEDYVLATASIQRFLDGRTVAVSTLERGGHTYVRLHAAGDRAPKTLGPADATVSEFTVTAYVTPEGFVRSLTAEYELRGDGDRARVSLRYDYSRVGESSPAPPDWVGQADQEATPARSDSDATPNGTSTPGAAPAGTATATDSLDASTRTTAPGSGI